MQSLNLAPKAVVLRVFLATLLIYAVLLLSKIGYNPSFQDNWSFTLHNSTESESLYESLKEQFRNENNELPNTSTISSGELTTQVHQQNYKAQSLSLEEAQKLCGYHELPVFDGRDTRKVYDLFLAGTELDILEIRMNELAAYVDYFVIVESKQTFTFRPKPLHFKENYHRFQKFDPQIIYRVIDFEGMENNSAWDRERVQRNALFDIVFPGLLGEQAAKMQDAMIVSDLDEIPRPLTVQLLRNCEFPLRTTIRSEFYYYSFQWKHSGSDWHHPQATWFQGLDDTIRPEDLRGDGSQRQIANASWHCSSCFSTVAEMKQKIESFSHTEYNHARFKDPSQVVRRVRHGLDLFDRPSESYVRIESNQDLPQYLKDRKDKFPWLVNRDPPNANFMDYFGTEGKIEDMTED